MATFYDVPADALIDALADRLAERIEEPAWAGYVKTGANRELAPEDERFWDRRAASILRKVAIDGPVGVNALRTEYGGAKEGSQRYGVAPATQAPAGGKIIRTILQQLEAEGLVEEVGSAGRGVTSEGHRLLNETAEDVLDDLVDSRPELERYA